MNRCTLLAYICVQCSRRRRKRIKSPRTGRDIGRMTGIGGKRVKPDPGSTNNHRHRQWVIRLIAAHHRRSLYNRLIVNHLQFHPAFQLRKKRMWRKVERMGNPKQWNWEVPTGIDTLPLNPPTQPRRWKHLLWMVQFWRSQPRKHEQGLRGWKYRTATTSV